MLKTNSKMFKINLENYILNTIYEGVKEEHRTGYMLDIHIDTVEDAKKFILDSFKSQYVCAAYPFGFESFRQWCQGLVCFGLTDYYYKVSAVDLLGDMLEQTEAERNRFTEDQAEEKVTSLIWDFIRH